MRATSCIVGIWSTPVKNGKGLPKNNGRGRYCQENVEIFPNIRIFHRETPPISQRYGESGRIAFKFFSF
jgi:hypothetical protein